MTMPKTTETRCTDGSVQARHFLLHIDAPSNLIAQLAEELQV